MNLPICQEFLVGEGTLGMQHLSTMYQALVLIHSMGGRFNNKNEDQNKQNTRPLRGSHCNLDVWPSFTVKQHGEPPYRDGTGKYKHSCPPVLGEAVCDTHGGLRLQIAPNCVNYIFSLYPHIYAQFLFINQAQKKIKRNISWKWKWWKLFENQKVNF